MAEIHHFSYGPLTPVLALLLSFAGSLLGLRCTVRARDVEGRARAGWLALGAVAIGGTGIWVMHFIAMLGFEVRGMEIRYDAFLTLLSALVAVLVVGAGLFIVGFGGFRPRPLLGGGALTGAGVASMHYLGMAAMNMSGHVEYNPLLVVASVLIALVAATAALWFSARLSGGWTTTGAAAIMAVAISGMHYTGMLAMEVHADPALGAPSGATALDFLLPLFLGVSLVSVLLMLIIAVSPRDADAN
ncbi:hypothetical protein DPM19_12285 [Actinomadura craniellae]|uniref:MHYT domain-containing protein n=1 Tax=Actinomadura craniellae TaxID=2231787 RepID=A0A365H6C6_9ACTN|nr:MHYT domain-containing protein [Actinomadura craniellae]RAY14552.1 hypothetical protein DPM19_12285 [Actinomadura craniellae]